MAVIGRTGLWTDRSQPPILGATLTLPVDQGYYLLTSLALLITLAGASFWNLTALLLHRHLITAEDDDAVQHQHRVALVNLGSASKIAWESIKIHKAWKGKGVHGLRLRTLRIVALATLVRAIFSAASIFASRIAISGGSGSDVVSPIQPQHCRPLLVGSSDDFIQTVTNQTLRARNYVNIFYNNASLSSITLSQFKSVTLPIETNTSAPCPFPNPDRCLLGRNGATSVKTPPVNSHHAFGINAPPADQITFQYEAVCSPIRRVKGDYERVTKPPDPLDEYDIPRNYTRALFGAGQGNDGNVTYQLYDETINTQAGYLVQPAYARAGASVTGWTPTSEFNRSDADMTIFFLSANSIVYTQNTSDPWFLANGTRSFEANGTRFSFANHDINALGCTEQFTICNPNQPSRPPSSPSSSSSPSSGSCLPPAGLYNLQAAFFDYLSGSPSFSSSTSPFSALNLTIPQVFTVTRLLSGMNLATLYYNVMPLRGSALWASDLVYANISPGLPEDQWRREVTGWFQMGLVRLQSSTIEFARPDNITPSSPPAGEGEGGGKAEVTETFTDMEDGDFELGKDQCWNQLVRTKGEMQNFSFLGIMVIICVSFAVIFLDVAGGGVMRCWCWVCGKMSWGPLARWRTSVQEVAAARQTDNIFHLAKLALPQRWVVGRWGIPVVEAVEESSQVESPGFDCGERKGPGAMTTEASRW